MPPPLTKLQEKLRAKLQGGQFRHLNELLYSQTGAESLTMIREDPSSFEAYHTGFRRQVAAWPVNPLDLIIHECLKHPGAVVADFGCGEARLAATLTSPTKTGGARFKVHSFDLSCPPGNPYVTACDMAHVPLATGTADIVVFCLSLMGTNYSEFLREADRVLKPGGLLFVAEVRSRFASQVDSVAGRDATVEVDNAIAVGKKRGRERSEDGHAASSNDDQLPHAGSASAFDGVGAFISVVRSLGYKLAQRDESNTMFVLLFFIKRPVDSGFAAVSAVPAASFSRGTSKGSTTLHPSEEIVPAAGTVALTKKRRRRRGGHNTASGGVEVSNTSVEQVLGADRSGVPFGGAALASLGSAQLNRGKSTAGPLSQDARGLPAAPVLKACIYKRR
jgi:ribosomal RNA-processing protein 8